MRSRFLADQHGGVAPIFALALVPMIGLGGAALDYSRASAARTAMQASLDATTQGTSSVKLNGCSLSDNSADGNVLTVGGSATVQADFVGVVGGIGSSTGITATNGIRTRISPVADPYADVPAPIYSGCDQHN